MKWFDQVQLSLISTNSQFLSSWKSANKWNDKVPSPENMLNIDKKCEGLEDAVLLDKMCHMYFCLP